MALTPLLAAPPSHAQVGIIDTAIGGNNGDGSLATNAIVDPLGVDSRGQDLYIADANGNRIRKVTGLTGMISTVAGSGQRGFAGDGGPALQAELSGPADVAFDAAGNMFIADMNNRRVRRVSTAGIMSTVAGNGRQGFQGDGVLATTTSLSSPEGIALDSEGNLYIADAANRRVRRVNPQGIIATVAGTGVAGYDGDGGPATQAALSTPKDVWVDPAGNLYIADFINSAIRRVDPSGIITTVAGLGLQGFSGDGGLATQATLRLPLGMITDAGNNLLILDSANFRLRRVDSSSQIINTIAGNGIDANTGNGGPATSASLFSPEAVTADVFGNIFIGSRESTLDAWAKDHAVRRISPGGIITLFAGISHNGDGGAASNAIIDPHGMRFGEGSRANDLYIADRRNQQVRLVANGTGSITTVAGVGERGFSGDGGLAIQARLNGPRGVKADRNGNVWIADSDNHRVRRVTPTGFISTVVGTGSAGYNGDNRSATTASLNIPYAVDVDAAGNLYIADRFNNRIRRVTPGGIITTIAGTGQVASTGTDGPAVEAAVASPTDLFIAPDGTVYIVETTTHQVRKITPSGIITRVAGTGSFGSGGDGGLAVNAQLNLPSVVALDATGNIFIGDQLNNRVRRIDAVTGIITTIAGNGSFGNSGDGGLAVQAELQPPSGIAVAPNGYVYIAQDDSGSVRRVLTDVPPDTPTPLPSSTPTRTNTLTFTPTFTNTASPTRTWTPPATFTPSPTGTFTHSPTSTPTGTTTPTTTATASATATHTQSPTRSSTHTPTATATQTATRTASSTRTQSFTPTPSRTSTPSRTFTASRTPTSTRSFTATASRTFTRSLTPTRTQAPTGTTAPPGTATSIPTATRTPSPTSPATGTSVPSATATRSPTFTRTASPTATHSPSRTASPTFTLTRSPTRTATNSPMSTTISTPIVTFTRSATASATRTRSATPTRTFPETQTPTRTLTRSRTPTRTLSPTRTASRTATSRFATATPTPVRTATSTASRTFTRSYTPTRTTPQTPTEAPQASATATRTSTPTLTIAGATATETATRSPSPTASATAPLPGGPGDISGQIRQHFNANLVPSVNVLLEITAGGLSTMTQTTASGTYSFANVAEQAWIIEPSLFGELDGSVNATDAATVLSAAAGEISLTPEQIVAADVSGNGSVSSTDAALILQRATGMSFGFPVTEACNSDWVFFPAPAAAPPFEAQRVTQPDVTDERCVPGSITLDPLVGQVENLDFKAVAFGDVDGSWVSVRAGEGAVDSAITLGRPRLRGATAQVPVELAAPRQFRGLHLIVEYDPEVAVFVAIRPGADTRPALVIANKLQPGRLVIGAASATPIDTEQPFSLEFAPLRPGAYPDARIVAAEIDPL